MKQIRNRTDISFIWFSRLQQCLTDYSPQWEHNFMMLSFINAAKHDVSLTCFHFNTEEQSTYKFNANVDGGISG